MRNNRYRFISFQRGGCVPPRILRDVVVLAMMTIILLLQEEAVVLQQVRANEDLTDPTYESRMKKRWKILEPTTSYNFLDFYLTFPVSNWIHFDQGVYDVYDNGCRDGALTGEGTGIRQTVGITYRDTIDDFTEPSVTDDALYSMEEKTITVPVTIDGSTIANNQDLYTEIDENTVEINFCVHFGLMSLDPSNPMEANYKEMLVTLTVDMSPSGIELISGAEIASKQGQDADVQDSGRYSVVGYVCDAETGVAIDTTTNNYKSKQGELVSVCVKPDEKAAADKLVMGFITDFTWRRSDIPTMTQKALVDRSPATNALSFYDDDSCWRQPYCAFQTFLRSEYYTGLTESSTVEGSGNAALTFDYDGNPDLADGKRKRRRRTTTRTVPTTITVAATAARQREEDPRRIQQQQDPTDLTFDLSFGLEEPTEERRQKPAGGLAAGSASPPPLKLTILSRGSVAPLVASVLLVVVASLT